MMSSNALSRARTTIAQDNERVVQTPLGEIVANKIALAWIDSITINDALAKMGPGVTAWRAMPPAQNNFASICADMIAQDTRISCCGFQAYGWMMASGMSMVDVMRAHIGKILVQNTVSMSAEDISTQMKKGPMQIVALHVEDMNGWNDVRQISAAAVKAEAPMLMLISASVPAPEGVALDIISDWNQGAHTVRDAFASVRDHGAIRLVAMDDITPSAIDNAIMTQAGMTGEAMADAIQKNNDGAETAMNTAYQSPVESF